LGVTANTQAGSGISVSISASGISASATVGGVNAMLVRVGGPGDFFSEARSEGSSVSWSLPGNAPDGRYRYEIFAMAEGSAHREIGRFDVSGGQMFELKLPRFPGQSELKLNAGGVLSTLAEALLDLLVPAAEAQNLSAVDSSPSVFFDDTDVAPGSAEWMLLGDGGFFALGDFGVVLTTPLEIEPSANNEFVLKSDVNGDLILGNSVFIDRSALSMGVGTLIPLAPLHVFQADGTAKVLAEDEQVPANPAQPQVMFELRRPGAVRFDLVDEFNGNTWVFQNRNGAFDITLAGTGVQEFKVDSSGNLTIQGSLIQLSDAKAKADVRAVDGKEILTRLASLPISEWRYKKDASNSPHLGPMAQDFHAAFGLGADDRYIAPMDAAGVALVGVKELNRTLEKEIKVCDAEITALKQRLAALETALNRVLAARPAHLVAAHIGQPH
jgi:hypothetical protein